MKQLCDFNYKEARHIINTEDETNRIVDKFGDTYNYISRPDKEDDKIYLRKANDIINYQYFTLSGKGITEKDNQLFIEKEVDYSKFAIVYNPSTNVALCKLKEKGEYLEVFINTTTVPKAIVLPYDNLDILGYKGFVKIPSEVKDELFKTLYDLNIAYDEIACEYGNLVKHLAEGGYYKYHHTIFKCHCDIKHNMLNIASIPYIFLYDYERDTLYENSTLGLPKNIPMREASIEEINNIYNLMKEKKGLFDIEILKCSIHTKQDLEDLKYLFELQMRNIDDICISDCTKEDGHSLIPDLHYTVFIKYKLKEKLYKSDECFKKIYDKWIDDYIENVNKLNETKRVFQFKPIVIC